jgi:2-methylisocitrate lyase-like PEP mutase family enzyme
MPSTIRSAIASGEPLIIPSVYDGISARVAAELGFRAVYIGSYATGATKYGLPDLGYIGADDMADQIRRIADLVDIPIVADGEGGFGNPLHVARTIRLLERAGASAVHIEDHAFGKHLTSSPRVLPLSAAVDKIKAAVDAKTSANFLVIGRTDSCGSLGQEEALARAVAFEEAGADAVLVAAILDDAGWDFLRAEVRVPIFALDQPGLSARSLGEKGADAVIYYAATHFAAERAIRATLSGLAETGSVVAPEGLPTMAEFDTFLGIETARVDARRWGLL